MNKRNTVLGLNRRNIDYIYTFNDRKNYRLADDKFVSKKTLEKAGFPTPKLLYAYQHHFEIVNIAQDLKQQSDFAIKPARGMGGGGILVFDQFKEESWITTSGDLYDSHQLYHHAVLIMSGVYSLDHSNDIVLVEEKIQLDDLFERITFQGIPDIRVIVFKGEPVMAMLRIPTRKSKGKANLHAGGIGLAIDIKSGITHVADCYKEATDVNPDTGEKITGLQIPHWAKIIEMSGRIQEIVPLGYMGIDFVIDRRYGPQILELNVRPGLEIQNVNGVGLGTVLDSIRGEYE